MAGPVERQKRERSRVPGQASDLPIHLPLLERLADKSFLASPLQSQRHTVIPDPVADPVICPYVDEGANPAFEQRGNVVLRREHGVVRRMEGGLTS